MARKRNHLAHGLLVYQTGPGTPNSWTLINTRTGKPILTQEEIADIAAIFAELGYDIHEFVDNIHHHLANYARF
jgi:hypothetical protein